MLLGRKTITTPYIGKVLKKLCYLLKNLYLPMIELKEFKKLLGEEAENLTDEQIKQVYNIQDQLADIIFDMWLEKKVNKNKTNGLWKKSL